MRRKKHFTNRITACLLTACMIMAGGACGLSEDTKEVKEENVPVQEEVKEESWTEGVTALTGECNPLLVNTEGDQMVADYINAYILGREPDGEISGDSACDVTEQYDEKAKEVTYRLALRDGISFSDGTPATADDLIFTYYVLCDLSFDGMYKVCDLPIQGLDAYRYNGMSGKAFDKKVKKEMKSPSKKTKKKIANLIAKELQKEYDWVGTLYESDTYAEYTGTYPARKDLFAFFYNLDGSYDSSKVEDEEKVLADITKQYGSDYKTLAKATGRDYDEQVKRIAIASVLDGEAKDAPPHISGIKKVDESTISITLSGYKPHWMDVLCRVPLLSLASYGDVGAYNYEGNSFGVTKGDVSVVESKQDGIGAGAYTLVSYQNQITTLQARGDYWGEAPEVGTLILKNVTVDNALPALVEGSIDRMHLNGLNEQQRAALEEAEDVEVSEYVPQDNLIYFGLNAASVKVGKDRFSKESTALRQAFATLLSVYKRAAIHNYYGEEATVADTLTKETTATAYDTGVDGAPLYSEGMSEYEKYDVALEAFIEFLKSAGYTYDTASGMFTKAPKGASLSYTATIVAGGSGRHAAYAILTSAREALESVGIMLKINDIQDSNELYDLMKDNKQQIFVASMVQAASTDYREHFAGDGVFNFVSYKNDKTDALLDDLQTFHTAQERRELLDDAWSKVLESAVFVPIYRKNTLVLSRKQTTAQP